MGAFAAFYGRFAENRFAQSALIGLIHKMISITSTNKSFLLTCCLVFTLVVSSTFAASGTPSPQSYLVGKWAERTPGIKEETDVTITSVDAATGQIKGKWVPPSGPAAGKEFDLIGWVSTAPPVDKADNVVVVSFTVSLSTYGSLASFIGYLKDNQLITLSHNVRPNAPYEWAHVVANTAIFTKK
jgi:Avidin family